MNNWILFLILTFLFISFYLLRGKKFGASNIFVLTYLIPLIVILLYFGRIHYVICEIVFFIGETVFLRTVKQNSKPQFENYEIKQPYLILMYAIQLLNIWVGYRFIKDVGSSVGSDNFMVSLFAARKYLTDAETSLVKDVVVTKASYAGIVHSLSLASEVICIQLYLTKRIVYGEKGDRRYLGVVVLYFLSLLFETGRSAYLYPIVHVVYLMLFFIKQKMRISQYLFKNLPKVLITVSLLWVVFLFLGFLRGDTDGDASEVDSSGTLIGYVGAPIVGFDMYIMKGAPRNKYIGEWMFQNYYVKAVNWGIIPSMDDFKIESYQYGVLESNVNSAAYRWISDFGYLGAVLFVFILGCIFGVVNSYERTRMKGSSFWGIYYVSLLYASLIMSFFGDVFYAAFSYAQIYMIIAIYVIKRVSLKRITI